VQKTGGPILALYMSRDMFLCKKLPLQVTMFAPALKFLVAVGTG